ncbi:hypothetical protein QMK19_32790 [Streptomyces sp. H10-C2]|nr:MULTISPECIES: hypothetical protein [unclassified Streptomyces]MDJ0345453.1 hypothetical protein [Streptomyces sp. PH10-H1]MDJ0374283.1 hypothetical protein [Streptomyces sp. H10-C2]
MHAFTRGSRCVAADHGAAAFIAAGSHDKTFARFVDCIMPHG